jgi:hypothetical protein
VTLSGRAVTAEGTPVVDAEVSVLAASKSLVATTRTNAQGRFSVLGLSTGVEYRVEVTNERVCHGERVTVRDENTPLEVIFGGWTVRGQVVDANGKGVATRVTAVLAERVRSLCDLRMVTSDSHGEFSIPGVDADHVEVALGSDASLVRTTVHRDDKPVTLVMPTMPGKRTITGVVLDPERRPIRGALVAWQAFTGDDGRYTLDRKSNEPAVVPVSRRCFVAREVPETEADVVVLQRRPCLAAYVVDEQHRPVAGMHALTVVRTDGGALSSCTTRQQEADCTLEAELGEVTVSGKLADGRPVSATVNLTGTAKQDVFLVVK